MKKIGTLGIVLSIGSVFLFSKQVQSDTSIARDNVQIEELQELEKTTTDTRITEEDVKATYTPEQKVAMSKLEKNVEAYGEYGEEAPIEADVKNRQRAKIGSWSWRDGVICVTDAGSSMLITNSWHAGIVAPQKLYVVAEAEGINKKVRLRYGTWSYPKNTVWQVGVKKTSVAQDLKAGRWAGEQVGKPYNLNFWNIKQKKSFYCSQLVWAAYYYTCGVDLDKPDNNIGPAWAVHPGEFVKNSQTSIIYRSK